MQNNIEKNMFFCDYKLLNNCITELKIWTCNISSLRRNNDVILFAKFANISHLKKKKPVNDDITLWKHARYSLCDNAKLAVYFAKWMSNFNSPYQISCKACVFITLWLVLLEYKIRKLRFFAVILHFAENRLGISQNGLQIRTPRPPFPIRGRLFQLKNSPLILTR